MFRLDLGTSLSVADMYNTCTVVQGLAVIHYCVISPKMQGWGCGYRSLQSICSWVGTRRNLNSKCSNPQQSDPGRVVPSLQRIQETLVEVGDKPASFVGSREWIGSYEVCIVLDQLYEVSNPVKLQTTQVLLYQLSVVVSFINVLRPSSTQLPQPESLKVFLFIKENQFVYFFYLHDTQCYCNQIFSHIFG